jgi:hypothetical protein
VFDENEREKMSRLSEIPSLKDHHNQEFLWNMHPNDTMSIVIYHWGKPVMSFSLHEAIESSSRSEVIKHIIECDNTPWLHRWQKEKKDAEYADVVDILMKDY